MPQMMLMRATGLPAPWSEGSKAFEATIARTTTISMRGQAGSRRRMAGRIAGDLAPTGGVVRLVSGIALILDHASSA